MRQEENHRGYLIVGDVRNGKAQAAIFKGGRQAAPRFAADTVEEAMADARQWVDNSHAVKSEGRRAPNIGTAEEYADYFRLTPLADYERAMLQAHARAGTLTATELSEAAGWQDFRGANRYYGELGKKIGTRFGLTPKEGDYVDEIWTTILAEGADGIAHAHYRWTIHPEVIDGLIQANIIAPRYVRAEAALPDDPFDRDPPDVWLTSTWGFDPHEWGFIGFSSEADRARFLEDFNPGGIVAVYVTSTSPHSPQLRGKLVGFLELTGQPGTARDFMPGDAFARKEADPDMAGRWNFGVQAARAWKIEDEHRPMIDEFVPRTAGDPSSRIAIARYCKRFDASEARGLLDLPVVEVPCFGGRRTFDTTPEPFRRKLSVSSAVPRATSPYTVEEADGPKHLYILKLHGNLSHFLGRPAAEVEGLSVIKVGYSGSPKTRCYAFNKAMPECAFDWKILKVEVGGPPSPDSKIAAEGENAMKYSLQRTGAEPLGYEFFLANDMQIEGAWLAGQQAVGNALSGEV